MAPAESKSGTPVGKINHPQGEGGRDSLDHGRAAQLLRDSKDPPLGNAQEGPERTERGGPPPLGTMYLLSMPGWRRFLFLLFGCFWAGTGSLISCDGDRLRIPPRS